MTRIANEAAVLVQIAITEGDAYDVAEGSHAGEQAHAALEAAADIFEHTHNTGPNYVGHDLYGAAYALLVPLIEARIEEVTDEARRYEARMASPNLYRSEYESEKRGKWCM